MANKRKSHLSKALRLMWQSLRRKHADHLTGAIDFDLETIGGMPYVKPVPGASK